MVRHLPIVSYLFLIFVSHSQAVVRENDLILWYTFEELDVDQVTDQTDNGLDGILEKNPTVEAAKFGNALRLNGNDQKITVPHDPVMNTPQYTVAVWINSVKSNEAWVGLFGRPGRHYNIWLGDSNKDSWFVHHRYRDGGNGSVGPADARSFPHGEWTHIAITNDGRASATFVNGIHRSTGALNNGHNYTSSPIYIGANVDNGSNGRYEGLIDDIRLYSKSLNAVEVAKLYNKGRGDFNDSPIITVDAPEVIELSLNEAFTLPSATAEDTEDGDISDKITNEYTYSQSITRQQDLAAWWRFDYEDPSQNQLVDSTNFSSSSWISKNVTVQDDTLAAPDVTITADTLIEGTTTANSHQLHQSFTAQVDKVYTATVFAKADSATHLSLSFKNYSKWEGGGGAKTTFDLSTGTSTPDNSTPQAHTMEALEDGWYRCRISAKANGNFASALNIFLNNGTGTTYDGDGSRQLYLWGAQVETGEEPTEFYNPATGKPVIDFSHNYSHGTLVGDAKYVEGKFGQAVSLDGNGDYALIPALMDTLENTSVLTITAWSNIDSAQGASGSSIHDAAILTTHDGPDRAVLWFNADGAGPNLPAYATYFGNTAGSHLSANAFTTKPKEWQHVAAVMEKDVWKIYLDGELQTTRAENTPTEINLLNQQIRIGSWSQTTNFDYPGKLDDVRLYSAPLNDEDIAKIYGEGDGDFIAYDRSTIDTSIPGEWIITWSVMDSFQNTAMTTRTLIITDPEAPTIELAAGNPYDHQLQTPWEDPGVTIVDKEGNLITDISALEISGYIDTDKAGTYMLEYSFPDANGRQATPVRRTIHVHDITPPELTLSGPDTILHQMGQPFVDPGFTAVDSIDGILVPYTSLMTPDHLLHKGSRPGWPEEALNLDHNGGMMQDTPVGQKLFQAGPRNAGLYLDGDGDFLAADVGISGNDNYRNLFIGYFRAVLPGIYQFGTQNADDRVAVWLDLDQDNIFEIKGSQGGELVSNGYTGGYTTVELEPGYYRYAVAHIEGTGHARVDARFYAPTGAGPTNLTRVYPGSSNQLGLWFADNQFSTSIPGQHTITYEITDKAGNLTTKTRTVIVDDYPERPKIQLTGRAVIKHPVRSLFSDPGAMVTDFEGNPIDGVTPDVSGSVDVNVPGTYRIIYNWKGPDGLGADTVTRVVEVLDLEPPRLILSGSDTVEIILGEPYVEPGVDAVDNFDPGIVVGSTASLPTDGLWMHIDAGQIPGVDDGKPFPTWIDLSGNGRDMDTQTGKPLFTASALNGLPAVYFDGETTLAVTDAINNKYSIFTVSQLEGSDNERLITSRDKNWLIGYNNFREDVFHPEGYTSTTSGVPVTVEPHLYSAISTGASHTRFWGDGQDLTFTDNLNGNMGRLQLGGYWDNLQFTSSGYVSEILLYDRALTEAERLAIETRLATKYKLMDYPVYPLPDFNQVGNHTILYAARDSSGNTTFATRTVVVKPDPSIPIIHLTDGVELIHEAQTPFTDPGAVAKDGDGNVLDQTFLKSIGSIDVTKKGIQTLSYTYETEDLSAEPVTRKVIIVDTTPPVITLTGDALVELKIGDTYVIEGATAEDMVDGTLTTDMTNTHPHLDYEPGLLGGQISSNPMSFAANPGNIGVDPLGPGKAFTNAKGGSNWRDRWTFVYTGQVFDADGIISFRESIDDRARVVIDGKVVFDNNIWNVNSNGIFTATKGGWFDIEIRMWNGGGGAGQVNAPGIGYDPTGGNAWLPAQNSNETTADLFRFPTPDTTKINTDTAGTYVVNYTATDAEGNVANATRTILILPDDSTPYILLHGDKDVTIEAGTIAEYTDPKAIAKAADGTTLQDGIEGTGEVDTDVPGNYALQYIYQAPNGTFAQAVTRTIEVVDTTPPELTLKGEAFVTLLVDETYTDAGASATDNLDGDISALSDFDAIPNRLTHMAYTLNFSDLHMDFDQNGGLLAQNPRGNLLFNEAINFNGDAAFRAAHHGINRNDNYQNLWIGNFNALRDGEYYFLTTGVDDRATIYLDKDQDGIFERLSENGDERLTYGNQGTTIYLVKGAYLIAIAHQEAGGGSRVQARFRAPDGVGPATTADINPGHPDQDGLWSTSPTTLDTSQPGRHTITYYAEDSAGNLTTKTRTIVIEEDPFKPVLLLLGNPNISHEAGTPYVDAGVLLEDYQGNPLDETMVTITNLPDGFAEGKFTVTYEFIDSEGHKADPVTRSVMIQDTLEPVLELIGSDPLIVVLGSEFVDPGFLTTDVFDKDLATAYSYKIPDGLIFHLDAATLGETLNDGDVVNISWDDISGEGHHANKMAGDPTWIASGLNGLPVVNFDGDQDRIWTTTKFHNIITEHTLFTVARYAGDKRGRVFSTADGRNWLFGFHNNGVGRWHSDGWIVNTGPNDTNWHLHVGHIKDDLANFWRDGVQLGKNSTGAHPTNYRPTDFQMGGFRGGNEFSTCEVAEVLLFNQVLNDQERLKVQSHLNEKYGLNGGGTMIAPVDTSLVGEREVQYSVSDDAGHLVNISRTIRVVDPATLPKVRLNGDAEIVHAAHTDFTDPGYVIQDAAGNEIPDAEAKLSTNLNTTKPGTYTIAYDYTDQAGNPAPTATRTIVVTDQTPPIITLVGGEVWEHQIGNRWIDPGYSAEDTVDGEVHVDNSYLLKGRVRGRSYSQNGTQYLDLDQNGGYFHQTPIDVVENYSMGPQGEGLRVRGAAAFNAAFVKMDRNDRFGVMWDGHFHTETGGRYEFGVEQPDDRTAMWIDLDQNEVFEINGDAGDERVNQNYQYGYRTFDLKPGFYRFALAYYEGTGGEHVQPRVRALSGKGPSTLTWINPSAANQRDLWVRYNPFDVNTPGEYEITYTAWDAVGNESKVTRTVIVKNNPDAPTITLTGDSEITLGIGEIWVEPGTTVVDFAGDPIDTTNNPVHITGDVKAHLGEYVLLYDFTSEEGVPARTVTRTVIVADNIPPVITLNGEPEITVLQGQPFEDPGATALDNYDGTLLVGSSQGVPEDGLEMHLDASEIAGVEDGDMLPIWFDSSPAKSHLNLRGGSPVYKAKALNGHPAVYFDGASRFASEKSFGNIYSIFTVSQLHGVLDQRLITSLNRNWLLGYHGGKKGTFHPEAWVTSGHQPADTLPHLHGATSTGANNVRFYEDSLDRTVFRTRNGLIGQIQLGAFQGGNESSIGDVAEVILYNRVLSTQERLSIEALLNAKYAINGVPAAKVPVNLQETGTYEILYLAVDGAGNIGSSTRTVHVVPDPNAPIITLEGEEYIVLEAGTDYVEPGFSLSDKDGDLDPTLVEIFNPFIPTQPGQYTIRYNYAPEFGLHAPEVSRIVEVRDTQAPVISLEGETYVKLEVGETWEDPGYSAVDAGTGNIPVLSDEWMIPNQMTLTVYTEASGGDALLNLDQNGGIMALEPVATHPFDTGPGNRGSDFNNSGEMGSPQGDQFQVLLRGKFFAPVKGAYQLAIIDRDDNVSMWVDLDQDEMFELDGDKGNERVVGVNQGGWQSFLLEPGVYDLAVSFREGGGGERFEVRYGMPRGTVPFQNQRIRPIAGNQLGLWAIPRVASTVDTSQAGTYTITYNARDISGNTATAVRTIVVVDDASLPFIALKGDTTITHELGTAFTDPGAKVTEGDTEVEANLQATVPLDINKLGLQTLTYEYTNATSVTRTVEVIDTTQPVPTLVEHPTYGGTDTVKLLAKQEWIDPGVTIADEDTTAWFVSSRDYIPNQLLHAGFNTGGSLDFNNNGSILAMTPRLTRFFTHGPGNRGFDFTSDQDFQRAGIGITSNDNYRSYALGYFHARVDGDYTFNIDQSDDDVTVWIDIDGNGIFQDPNFERIVYDASENTVPLLAGFYRVILGHREGGGASRARVRIRTPENAGPSDVLTTVKPADPKQNGLWLTDGEGPIDTTFPGTHTITYYVMDQSGNTSTITRTVVVEPDPDAPILALVGDADLHHEQGTTYEDPGVTIKNAGGDDLDPVPLKTTITQDGQVVAEPDTSIAGLVTYLYEYDDGNKTAIPLTRTITIADTTAPSITLNGESSVTISPGFPYLDPGVTFEDSADPHPEIIVTGDKIEFFYSGTLLDGMVSNWNFEEPEGNEAFDLTGDNHLTFTGSPLRVDTIHGRGLAFNNNGTAETPHSASLNLTEAVSISAWFKPTATHAAWDKVLVKSRGTIYPYGFSFDDKNQFVFILSTDTGINTAADILPPMNQWTHALGTWDGTDAKLYINGALQKDSKAVPAPLHSNTENFAVGGRNHNTNRFKGHIDSVAVWNRALTAEEARQLDQSFRVKTLTEGEYQIHYTVTDDAGNSSETSRTIIVKTDPTIPVLHLVGDKDVTHEAGTAFEDPGASPTDSRDNPLDATKVTTQGTVDHTQLGTYSLTYNFTNEEGKDAVPVHRSITVVDTTPPTIDLLEGTEYRVDLGSPEFVDPGYTVTDNLDPDADLTVDVKLLSASGKEPIAHWNFDQTTGTTLKELQNGLDGNLAGFTAPDAEIWVDGKYGKALKFNGVSSYIQIPNPTLLDLEQFTLSLWINTDDYARNMLIFEKTRDNTVNSQFNLFIEDPDLIFRLNDGIGGFVQRTHTAADLFEVEKWHHIATTYDGSMQKIFVDGVLVDQFQQDITIPTDSTTGHAYIGALAPGAGYHFEGLMDDLKIYDEDIIEDQIKEILKPTGIDTSKPTVTPYIIEYTSTDSNGNTATVQRKVIVSGDENPPGITLHGDLEFHVETGTPYEDPGYIAIDPEDGNLTLLVTFGDSLDKLDTSTPGEYTITYDVMDLSFNKAPQKTRKVIVSTTDPLQLWKNAHYDGLTTEQQENTADPDRDGMENLLEYALGGDPKALDRKSVLPFGDTSGASLTIHFLRVKPSIDTKIQYTVELSNNLNDPSSWSDANVTVTKAVDQTTVPQNLADKYELYKATANTPIADETSGQQFIRISVTR